jgi:hypothetical protein
LEDVRTERAKVDAERAKADTERAQLTTKVDAERAKADALSAQLSMAMAQVAQLKAKYMVALRLERVVRLRSALDLLLSELHVDVTKKNALAVYLAEMPLGAATLQRCNTNATVLRDHFKKQYDAAGLADVLMRIRERLNNNVVHLKQTAHAQEEYRDAGDALEVKSNGLSEAHVQVLACLFEAHAFPVRIVGALSQNDGV